MKQVITNICEDLGISRKELAYSLGMRPQELSSYSTGCKSCPAPLLNVLAAVWISGGLGNEIKYDTIIREEESWRYETAIERAIVTASLVYPVEFELASYGSRSIIEAIMNRTVAKKAPCDIKLFFKSTGIDIGEDNYRFNADIVFSGTAGGLVVAMVKNYISCGEVINTVVADVGVSSSAIVYTMTKAAMLHICKTASSERIKTEAAEFVLTKWLELRTGQ